MARGTALPEDLRQLASETLLAHFSACCEGAVIVDKAGCIVWMNDSYPVRLGIEVPSCVVGQPIEKIIPNSLMRQVVQSGQPMLLDIMEYGEQAFVVTRLPLRDEAGEVVGAVGFMLYDDPRRLAPLIDRYQRLRSDLAEVRRKLAEARRAKYTFADFVGAGALSSALKQAARRAARTTAPVLILGETGTGKELLAQAIHAAGARSESPFVAVNIAAVPETLLEAEFFGVAPGAYTGAERGGRDGKFKLADGGTLFLDEIGDMPLVLQSRLLRVLAEGEVLPLGAEQPIPVRLHIVCATHQDLPRLVAEGRFREDLYYRLNGAVFLLPPLREREDIGTVIDRVLHEEAQAMSRELRLADETRDALMRHPWPGNIRQLRHAMRYACAISDGPLLMPQSFPPDLFTTAPSTLMRAAAQPALPPLVVQTEAPAPALKPKDLALRERMLETLRRNQWQVTVSARELGLSRATFYRKLAKLQIVAPNRQAW